MRSQSSNKFRRERDYAGGVGMSDESQAAAVPVPELLRRVPVGMIYQTELRDDEGNLYEAEYERFARSLDGKERETVSAARTRLCSAERAWLAYRLTGAQMGSEIARWNRAVKTVERLDE